MNHSPSFTCDSPLDLSIKEELISTALDLVSKGDGLGWCGLVLSLVERVHLSGQQKLQALKLLGRGPRCQRGGYRGAAK